MGLDDFDLYVLSLKGNAQELAPKVFGQEITSFTNAEKYLTGTRKYLKHKQGLNEGDIPIHYKREFAKDGSRFIERLVLLSESDMENPTSVMQKMGLDPVQWELIDAVFDAKSWQVTMKLYQAVLDDEGKPQGRIPDKVHKETNWGYNCKIRVKPLQDKVSVDFMRSVYEGLVIPTPKEYKYATNGLMWEIGMPDIHMGKLAWAEETGEDNYDIKIAGERSRKTVENFLAKAGTYERILFPVGQDFFHVDNVSNETTAGTRMDVEGRWQKLYREGIGFLVWAVAELRRLAPVDVFYVPGNHDKMLSYCAVDALAWAFAKADGVTVDLSPQPRKYRSFGKCLIGFSHGKEGKKLNTIMQHRRKDLWAASDYREWHLSDLHHERVWEEGGIIFRRIPAITSTDAWHNEKGFVGAIRKAQAFEWDKEIGLVNIHNSVVRDYDLAGENK